MSNFICEHCGAEILDSPTGYTTGCEHYPIEECRSKKEIAPIRRPQQEQEEE